MMTTIDLYKEKTNCCGCELCSLVCPRNIIKMQPDEEGFLYPLIDDDSACINCHRCLTICPEKSPGHPTNQIIESYGGYSLDTTSIKHSSSGGYATAISQAFVQSGGVVYGVRFTDDLYGVEYSRAYKFEDLEAFRTSKYSQARKGTVYIDVLNDLEESRRVLFIGLPCEVSALYHFVGRKTENLYTISLICHGPTSPKVQKDFVKSIESCHKSKVMSFSLRNKQTGWKPYYILAEMANGEIYKQKFNKSAYGTAFLYMKRPSCSTCRYKCGDKEFGLMSDITLGDFHAVGKDMLHYNVWGVSQLCVQSEKGKYLLGLITQTCKVVSISNMRIETGNIALHHPLPMEKNRDKYVEAYINHSLDYANHLPMIVIRRYHDRVKKDIIRLLVKIKHLILKPH